MKVNKTFKWRDYPTYRVQTGNSNWHHEEIEMNEETDKPINECDNYFRRVVLAHSLLIDYSYNSYIKAIAKIEPCKYMENRARCIDKQYYISSNLSKDYFIHLMTDCDFEVLNWNVTLLDTNNYKKGFNYKIKGYNLIYKK